MEQQALFSETEPKTAKPRFSEKPKKPAVRFLPKRITWRERSGVYRGRPWAVHPFIGNPELYKVWITHTPRGFDLGWNRNVVPEQALSFRW